MSRTASNSGDGPLISVAVCTRDRPEDLRVTLPAILAQRAECSWELLVVDNGDRVPTEEVLATLGEHSVAVRHVLEPEPGADRARARALSEARGQVLVFADDDVTPLAGWLQAYADVFANPNVASAGGRIFPELPDEIPEWVRRLARHIGGPPGRYDFGREPRDIDVRLQSTPFGGNMAIRVTAARDVGGFSLSFGYGRVLVPGEDTDLTLRLMQAGHVARYVPSAVVFHRVPESKLELDYFTAWWKGLGRSRVIQRHSVGGGSANAGRGPRRALLDAFKFSLRRARRTRFSERWFDALMKQQIAIGELLGYLGR